MTEFIADLEARASLVGNSDANDASEFCAHCRKPLRRTGREHRRVCAKDHCEVCADLFQTVLMRRYFVCLQFELEIQRGTFNHIHPDKDYF